MGAMARLRRRLKAGGHERLRPLPAPASDVAHAAGHMTGRHVAGGGFDVTGLVVKKEVRLKFTQKLAFV